MTKTRITIFMDPSEKYSFSRETSSAAETYMSIFKAAEALNMPEAMRSSIQEKALEHIPKIYAGKTVMWGYAGFKVEKITEEN